MNYKKWFTSLGVALTLILSIGCSTLPLQTSGDIPPHIVAWANTHVWKIPFDNGGHGSAFWINNRQLVTACHVVEGDEDGYAINDDGNDLVLFTVGYCDTNDDIAILERVFQGNGKDTWFDSTRISYFQPVAGEIVYGAGYPLWWPLTINDGHYGQEIRDGQTYRYTNSVPTIHGDSGSPLLTVKDGIIWIHGVRVSIAARPAFMGMDFMPHMAMATSGRMILNALVEYNNMKQMQGR